VTSEHVGLQVSDTFNKMFPMRDGNHINGANSTCTGFKLKFTAKS